MKKKKNALLIILAAVVAMLVMSVNVWAAQKNPSGARCQRRPALHWDVSVRLEWGATILTPEYYNREKVKI